ncbi:MAG TPA: T9SS type A sorting domain-containing protein [Chitinophagaceae bacterium]|jgi:endonuclease/exonuclease/phosphatase family metal-dependent hydrolase|nr:T9SS type A sorting domain-containing protein [Chitinophagaceae bacterium]
MKKIFILYVFTSAFLISKSNAQSSATTLDIVSWNLEFFGAPYNSGPDDKDLQEANAKKIMRYFDADIYGLVEIVDTTHLRKLRDSLGTNYEYIIAPYSTDGAIGTNGWRQSQKLAFLYKKSVFSNISTRGLMLNSPTAVTNWASGRLPFLMKADATINGTTKTLHFIVIHGKAGSTATDYNKRLAGAQELKDTLDAHFSTATTFIIGDFNDALNTSIYTGATVSSYTSIVTDSTDSDHYKSITLPLGVAGQTTMINFPNVIDNHIISNEAKPFYVPASAQVRTDVTTIVPDYVTAHNTSDHYPVFSKYNLNGVVTGLPNVTAETLGIKVYPNPYISDFTVTATKTITNVQFSLYNILGQLVNQQRTGTIAAGTTFRPDLPDLSPGDYFLQIETKDMKTVVKLTKL